MLSIVKLKTDPNAVRHHDEAQIEQLISSIRRFGFRGAILIDPDNVIIDGHAMVEAAKRVGMTEVPAICERFLNQTERRAFTLANKQLAELGEWDDDKLSAELEFLFNEEGGLDGTGFSLADLDFSIGDDPPAEEMVELPDPSAKAVSRVADLWHIGPHSLYCGDARDPASFEIVLGERLATVVFGDLPYNVPVNGHVRGGGKHNFSEFAFASGEMSPAEFTAFMRQIFRNCARFSADGSIHYQCMDFRHLREILDAAEGVYTELKQLVVWVKGGIYRDWNAFGQKPGAFRSNIIVEINQPPVGIDTNLQAAFARDDRQRLWLLHQGRMSVSGSRVTEADFISATGLKPVIVEFSDGSSAAYHQVTQLDGEAASVQEGISAFIAQCARARTFKLAAGLPSPTSIRRRIGNAVSVPSELDRTKSRPARRQLPSGCMVTFSVRLRRSCRVERRPIRMTG